MSTLHIKRHYPNYSCFVASQNSEVQEILGYIQTISPVKKAMFSPTRYFNCSIQGSNKVVRAVCFNPAKRPLLEKYHKGKTGVRLHNICSSIKDDVETIIIQNNTSVEPVALPYVYKDATISSSLPSLSSLQEVSKEQLVDVKAKISGITGVKTINSRYDHPFKKQEVIVVGLDKLQASEPASHASHASHHVSHVSSQSVFLSSAFGCLARVFALVLLSAFIFFIFC